MAGHKRPAIKIMRSITNNAQETIGLGRKLARNLKPGDVLALEGDLGSGKTTFTKGIALGLGVKKNIYVTSPSFVLIREYKEGKMPLYHLDLYRLDKDSELATTGYEEYIWGDGVTVIEWAEKVEGILPKEYILVKFSVKGQDKREIKITSKNKKIKL